MLLRSLVYNHVCPFLNEHHLLVHQALSTFLLGLLMSIKLMISGDDEIKSALASISGKPAQSAIEAGLSLTLKFNLLIVVVFNLVVNLVCPFFQAPN
jgi:hypothetical protein